MGYANNILKTEAAYYSLNRATITSGKLNMLAGGTATQHITAADLETVTDTMLFRCIVSNYSERYTPTVSVLVHIRNKDTQEYSNIQVFPIYLGNGTFSSIFITPSGEYDEMYVTISSDVATIFTIWELCPEAADEDIEVLIDGVKQSLPRLLYDYNTFPFVVGQQEATVALITCRLLSATDLQGHFAITFVATADTTVTVRFYDNDAEELFAPLYYDVSTGRNTIGIPHAYLQRKAGIHSFIVTMQAAYGSLTIDTRGCLFTIDGGYLAVRVLDIALDVTDIAIRQLSSDNGPDQIWVVGLDNDEALIRYRDYKETNANVAWTAVGSLGRALHAAIEFDGYWVLRVGAGQHTIETEEIPYIFIVTEENKLLAYHGIDDEAPYELDTDVTFVRACRAYSSIDYPEQDQGLVVAYLKTDKTAWYRQYVWNEDRQQFYWLTEVQIGTDTWDHINVSRLNDYRVSFQLSNSEKNLWIYSDRTWVGQATPPEIFSLYSGYTDKSAIYSSASFVRNVQIDSYSTTSVYDEDLDKYIWTVLFHFSKPVFKRGIEDTAPYVTLTGDLRANVQYISFNDEENAIEVTLWMLYDIDDVSIVSGDFTIASSDGIFVAEYQYGYANIDTLTKHWEINNVNRHDETYADTLVLGIDTTLNRLSYQIKTYKKLNQPNEAFTLGTGSGALLVGNVARQNIEIKTETFMLGADSTLNEISYAGTHIKPV